MPQSDEKKLKRIKRRSRAQRSKLSIQTTTRIAQAEKQPTARDHGRPDIAEGLEEYYEEDVN